MRAFTLIGFVILAVAALIVIPEASRGQFKGKGGGTKGGGGGGGSPFTFDPKARFDEMAKGRGYFLIDESKSRVPLKQFADSKKITDGKITYPVYQEFMDQFKTRMPGGGVQLPGGAIMKSPNGGGNDFTPGPVTVLAPAAPQQSIETLNKYADEDFFKRDLNDDGMLIDDEMPQALKDSLDKYDIDMDNKIDLLEYRRFFVARLKSMGLDEKMGKGKRGPDEKNPEDDWDRRVTVLRAGKLHKDLPTWFKDLDIDGDGQIALHEWRHAKKALDEFRTWDSNDDGFVTQEEALKLKLALTQKKGPEGSIASAEGGMRGPGMGGKGNKGGGNPFGGGGGGNPFGGGGGGNPFGGGGGFGKMKKSERQP